MKMWNGKLKNIFILMMITAAVLGLSQSAMAATTIDVTQTVIWDPDDNAYVIPDGNSRYISASELSNFSNLYLLIARNEFYARRGYIFNDSNIARYFNDKNWYYPTTPSSQFSASVFNDYESYNINVIVEEERRRGSTVNTIPWVDGSGSSSSSNRRSSSSTTIDVTQTVIWDPDDNAYVVPDGNSRYMTTSELANYSNLYLLIARNEFYARRGYIFNDRNIARYFNEKNWYYPTTPSSSFSSSVFNDYERYNIDLIVAEESRRGSTQTTITWVN